MDRRSIIKVVKPYGLNVPGFLGLFAFGYNSKYMGSSEELSHSSTGTYSHSGADIDAVCKYSSSFSSKSSGERDSPQVTKKSQYDCRVRSYGVLKNVTIPSEGSLELINVIDVAQCEERLNVTSRNDDLLMLLTQHGLRVFDASMQETTVLRIPLYKIERVVCFDDGVVGDVLLAFKVVNSNSSYHVYVYACENEDSCQKLCHKFSRVLDSVMSTATCGGETLTSSESNNNNNEQQRDLMRRETELTE